MKIGGLLGSSLGVRLLARSAVDTRALVARVERHDLGGRRKRVVNPVFVEGRKLTRKKVVVYCHKSYL